jgi:DNA gyrase subunit B
VSRPVTHTAADDYGASALTVLRGLDGVRKRPGMYIGSTDSRGLNHLVWEIVDNAVDEAAAGHARHIAVIVHDDNSVEVHDDGRGIPVDVEPTSGKSGVELVFTELHAGAKFGGGSYAASGGLHGVGASVVNALSDRLWCEVDRQGATWRVDFRRGVPGTFDARGTFTAGGGVRKVGKVPAGRTGTRVRFWPDARIFETDATFDFDLIVERSRQLAFLVPGCTVTVTDRRPEADGGSAVVHEFRSDKGLVDFVDYAATAAMAGAEPISPTVHLTGSGTFTETVPQMVDGELRPTEMERSCDVEVAFRWVNGWEYANRSFVNTITTPKGGTHVAGFERALTRVVNETLRSTKLLRDKDDNVTKEDIVEGLVAMVKVVIPEPQFEGQTKEILGTSAANSITYQVVADGLRAFFEANARRPQVKAALTKVVTAAKARLAARQQRETVRRKNALESSSMPAKLADCRSRDVERTELFLVEGDSAMGTAKAARDSEFQALLPLRGKILNAAKATTRQVLDNAECAAIITTIGAGAGSSFNLDEMRYGRIIILVDADVDGSHIRTLLLTLFHRYMRPMVEAGRVFAAMPPLFQIRATTGKRAVHYAYSDTERDQILAKLTRNGQHWKRPIQRYKGLGEMDHEQLATTTMDPATRSLRRLTVTDTAAAAATFELLMGSNVEPRREFIVTNSDLVDREALDI